MPLFLFNKNNTFLFNVFTKNRMANKINKNEGTITCFRPK